MRSPDEARRALDVVVREIALPVGDDHGWIEGDRLDEVPPELGALRVVAARRVVVVAAVRRAAAAAAFIPAGDVDAEQSFDREPVVVRGFARASKPRQDDVRVALVTSGGFGQLFGVHWNRSSRPFETEVF